MTKQKKKERILVVFGAGGCCCLVFTWAADIRNKGKVNNFLYFFHMSVTVEMVGIFLSTNLCGFMARC